MSAIAHIQSLSLGYSNEPLFSGLSLDIHEGMMLAVVGANGTGKSTFVKTVLGLHDPKIGTIHWPKGRPDEIGYLAQLSEFDRRFPIRVRDLAAMGAWKRFNPFSGLNAAARKKVDQALDQAGVLDLAERPLHTLSGGQLQRTLFARVIMQDAPLIILDEPFGALDAFTREDLWQIMRVLRKEEQFTSILITHDLRESVFLADQVVVMSGRPGTTQHVMDVTLGDERTLDDLYTPETTAMLAELRHQIQIAQGRGGDQAA